MPGQSAAALRSELSAPRTFRLIALFFGVLPSHLRKHAPLVVVSLLVLSAVLLIVSYSVLHWGWPPVGFEASAFVAVVSMAGSTLAFLIAVVIAVARLSNYLLKRRRAEARGLIQR